MKFVRASPDTYRSHCGNYKISRVFIKEFSNDEFYARKYFYIVNNNFTDPLQNLVTARVTCEQMAGDWVYYINTKKKVMPVIKKTTPSGLLKTEKTYKNLSDAEEALALAILSV